MLNRIINYILLPTLKLEKVDYVVVKFSDVIEKIIPFFDKYPILGVKKKDFDDFKLTANIMKNKEHLTLEGLEKIKKIK